MMISQTRKIVAYRSESKLQESKKGLIIEDVYQQQDLY